MAANTNPIFEKTAQLVGVEFENADGTSKQDLVTGAADGTRIDSISLCSDDTGAVDMAFWIDDGAADHYLGNVRVASGSGYTTVAKVEAIATLAPQLEYLWLPSGHVLKANAVAAVSAAHTLTVVVQAGNY